MMNVVITHKEGTSAINENIVLPTMNAIFNEVNGCSSTIEYMTAFTSPTQYSWSTNKNDLISLPNINHMPDIYIKRVNGIMNNCIIINSVEQCFDENTTASDIQSFCNTVGGEYNSGVGSNGTDDDPETISSCDITNSLTDGNWARLLYSANAWGYGRPVVITEKSYSVNGSTYYSGCRIFSPIGGTFASGCGYHGADVGY